MTKIHKVTAVDAPTIQMEIAPKDCLKQQVVDGITLRRWGKGGRGNGQPPFVEGDAVCGGQRSGCQEGACPLPGGIRVERA
ncbi:hypothetical protein KKB40_02095 [Patescibacteria group bacterium]|nr:hypothetical protein [Patescibacteria group bacterium]